MKAHNLASLEEILGSNNVSLESLPLKMLNGPFVITDPRKEDHPIIFVCDNFCELTGYKRSEIENRNCRFLQYKDGKKQTEEAEVQRIRELIKKGEEGIVRLTNYTKSGTEFLNVFNLIPLRDQTSKEIVLFFGGQTLTDSSVVPLKRASTRPQEREHSNVYYKCGAEVRKPNQFPALPFETAFTKGVYFLLRIVFFLLLFFFFFLGQALLKTVTDPLDSNVANYFQGRNRLFEVQAQFELKKPIPKDHEVLIHTISSMIDCKCSNVLF
jgi:PAS domain S-box-containing protein